MDKDRQQLDPLPGSDDKEFWGDAEINTNLVPVPVVVGGKHFFVRRSGREAQCTHCDWGFALDPGDYIKDGHLYEKTGKLVL